MFVSAKQLVQTYGIDGEISRFFVNREPPANNLYWHEKLLYLRPGQPAYLFIPLIVDLLSKIGLDKQELLSERFVTAMEQVGHISVLEEMGQISMAGAIEQCEELVRVNSLNDFWLATVTGYFRQSEDNLLAKLTTPFKSLHRGDIFLFSLSTLVFPPSLFEKIAQLWFALISLSLLVDDAIDIDNDKDSGDENAFIESGLNNEGLIRIANVVKWGVETISCVNAIMAKELERQHQEIAQQPYILKHLNPAL